MVNKIQKLLAQENILISKKNINLVLEARKKCDYSEVYKTYLYKHRGYQYCRLLEIINHVVNS